MGKSEVGRTMKANGYKTQETVMMVNGTATKGDCYQAG